MNNIPRVALPLPLGALYVVHTPKDKAPRRAAACAMGPRWKAAME